MSKQDENGFDGFTAFYFFILGVALTNFLHAVIR